MTQCKAFWETLLSALGSVTIRLPFSMTPCAKPKGSNLKLQMERAIFGKTPKYGYKVLALASGGFSDVFFRIYALPVVTSEVT